MEALQGTARKLWDFAKLHGLRDDWHEPDEQDIQAEVHGATFDNAHGDSPKHGEMLINLWQTGSAGDPERDIYLNLATLCALATIGAGVVLGETKQPTPQISKWDMPILQMLPPPDEQARFSRNDLAMILSTVLKSIGGD